MALTDKLTSIANAIRGKTGGTDPLTLDQMVEAIARIESGGGGLPAGMNALLLTLTESYQTQAAPGWTLTIPHGLGKVPGFAIVMRTTGITNAAHLRGWLGTNTENIRYTNKVGYGHEEVPMSDSSAAWIYADETNLYCKSGGWGGGLDAGTTLFVGVLE